jgi:ethanolamine ammonia-lyase small subunit
MAAPDLSGKGAALAGARDPDPRALPAPGSGRDPWRTLGAYTPARIALGRAGGSLRTESLLEFRLAHAGARDAVRAPFEIEALEAALREKGLATERLETAASDRRTYLARPDLGRRLRPESAERLRAAAPSWGRRDLAVLVSDGLAAAAAGHHAAETVAELSDILSGLGWALYPIFVVPFARVKLQDEVGGLLHARLSMILLGERPGLSSHDSLGAYLTFGPRADRTDAERNCVSNIRGDGLPPAEAARKLARILVESRRLGLSGTGLREPSNAQIARQARPAGRGEPIDDSRT